MARRKVKMFWGKNSNLFVSFDSHRSVVLSDVYCLYFSQCLFNDKSLTNKQYGVDQQQFVKNDTQHLEFFLDQL